MNSLYCCVMSFLSLLCGFLVLSILLKDGLSLWRRSQIERTLYKSLWETKLSMQQSLKFIDQANASIVYSPQLESFYEFSNWKRFPESTYKDAREGDYGQVNEYRTNTRFVNVKEGFNTIFNRALSLDRIVPDYRPRGCKYWHYKAGALPKVSVIIALTDEHEIILARTLTSILLTTPRDLLKEIILVYHRAEDKEHSPTFTKTAIMKKLRVAFLNPENAKLLAHFDTVTTAQMPLMFGEAFEDSMIKVLYTGKSIGLGASLNMGAKDATGDVFVFLKSRIELPHNWLQPLLAPILDDYRTVTIPSMLGILPASFKFEKPYNDDFLLTFWNRGLQTQQYELDIVENKSMPEKYEHIQALPYQLDLVTSSQFAISKDFFHQLGFFDPHYLILDEINLDLSFKVRTFGGRVMTTRCSHVFTLQKTIGPDPITAIFDEIYIANNYTFEQKCFLKTLANRWIGNGAGEEGGRDDGLHYFHLIHPSLTDQFCRGINNQYDDKHLNTALEGVSKTDKLSGPTNWLGNFHYRITKGSLIQSVQTDSFLATFPAENAYTGYLKNAAFSVCFHVEGDKVETAYCREKPTAAVLRLDRNGALRFNSLCFKRAEKKIKEQDDAIYSLESVSCFFGLPSEATGWEYTSQNRMRFQGSYCLSYRDAIGIVLALCSHNDDDVSQRWEWTLTKYTF